VVADHGTSGVSTKLSDREGGRRLFDKLRRGDVLVVRWVDRLGRNYQDVTDTIRHFMREGVIVRTVINNMTFDGATKDPMQEAVRDALIAFMAATAQAQAEATKEAQRAGIEANRGDAVKYRGKKPSYDRETFGKVTDMLGKGAGASAISKETGLSRQAVLRIRDHRGEAEAALARWGK
jgi:DNA invertase Pin-like site-specific DNA recombinase